MTSSVEPINLHHAMLRSQGSLLPFRRWQSNIAKILTKYISILLKIGCYIFLLITCTGLVIPYNRFADILRGEKKVFAWHFWLYASITILVKNHLMGVTTLWPYSRGSSKTRFWLTHLCSSPPAGSTDQVVVLSQSHQLVALTSEGHAYGEDVVALL